MSHHTHNLTVKPIYLLFHHTTIGTVYSIFLIVFRPKSYTGNAYPLMLKILNILEHPLEKKNALMKLATAACV